MPRIGPFKFTNDTGKNVNDLHVLFTGTGGTLKQGKIVAPPAPPGRVIAKSNFADVFWTGNIAPGVVVALTVDCRFKQAQPYERHWTWCGQVVPPEKRRRKRG